MFEQKRSGWNVGWAGIVLIVVAVLAVILVFRQNPPDTAAGSADGSKPMWTYGKIAEGPLEVEARGTLSFPMNLNKRSTLDATFTTGDNLKKVAFSVIAASDIDRWEAGEEVKFATNTGLVPRGTVRRVLEPGNYVIIFDNRAGAEPVRVVESNIEVE